MAALYSLLTLSASITTAITHLVMQSTTLKNSIMVIEKHDGDRFCDFSIMESTNSHHQSTIPINITQQIIFTSFTQSYSHYLPYYYIVYGRIWYFMENIMIVLYVLMGKHGKNIFMEDSFIYGGMIESIGI